MFPIEPHRIGFLGKSLATLAALFIAIACSPPRPSDHEVNDSGVDDTDLPWDSGIDTDFLVLEPVLIFERQNGMGFPAASFDGEHVAVSSSDVGMAEPEEYFTLFLAFPWETPEDSMMNLFAQQPPACGNWYGLRASNSVPFPHQDGFMLLTAGNDYFFDCEVAQTLWDTNANLLDGPHSFSGLFSNENASASPSMDPNGIADESGTAITGMIAGGDLLSDAGTASVTIDHWREGGFHSRLVHATYPWPWPYVLSVHSDRTFAGGSMGQNIFLRDGVLTVLGHEGNVVEIAPYAVGRTVLARIDTVGNIVQGLSYVEDDAPPVPSGLEGTTYSWIFPSFASNGEAILVIARITYQDLENYVEGPEPTIDEPCRIGIWSRMMSYDGTPLTGWIYLTEYESHVRYNKAYGVSWSGRYFGLCYNEPFDTFKMLAMDETGVPVAPPVDLFWEIPPVEDLNLPCELVAIDEDTFIAILSVYTEPEQAYRNGLWATRVDVNIPIE